MTQYWNKTTAALQPTCRGGAGRGLTGASRGPCLPTFLSVVIKRTAVQPTSLLALILDHQMLWNKLTILIIHP